MLCLSSNNNNNNNNNNLIAGNMSILAYYMLTNQGHLLIKI